MIAWTQSLFPLSFYDFTFLNPQIIFTVIKKWKEPKCPLKMDKENVVHIHSGILFSHKKNEILLYSATWIELDRNIFSKISWAQEEKCRKISPM
jgi:hypothetical protein